ncbi:MAG: hypothetical protein ABIM88_05540 [candidate division WOR-3 bacterium]
MKKVNLENVLIGELDILTVLKKEILGGAVVENPKAGASNEAVEA